MSDAAEPSPLPYSIAVLVEQARDPSAPLHQQHAAFTQLVERSQHLVRALARAGLQNSEEAEDAAQDSFTTAWLRLPQLRDPAAFHGWLRKIVATECQRRRRRPPPAATGLEPAARSAAESRDAAYRSWVAPALAALPPGERQVIVLFYYFGYTLQEIAERLRLKPGTVGKRLHSARLRIRRRLPRSVRGEFVRPAPARAFIEKVRLGLFDQYVGEYRFERRPDLVVRIAREGDHLVSIGGGQRHLLASLSDQTLLAFHYDGEGRFRRDRRGRVTHFVYYEFGRRLGVARKTAPDQELGAP